MKDNMRRPTIKAMRYVTVKYFLALCQISNNETLFYFHHWCE